MRERKKKVRGNKNMIRAWERVLQKNIGKWWYKWKSFSLFLWSFRCL